MSYRKDDPVPRPSGVQVEQRNLWRGISDEQAINARARRGWRCVGIDDDRMYFKPMDPPLRVKIRWGV